MKHLYHFKLKDVVIAEKIKKMSRKIIKCHQNSQQVYVIKCHEPEGSWNVFQFNMVTFDDKWRHLMTFRDISWHLMKFLLKITTFITILSWHVMIWPLLIQRGTFGRREREDFTFWNTVCHEYLACHNIVADFWAHLCNLYGGLICITLSSVCLDLTKSRR